MTDWDWFFSSEYGRDKLLRGRIEDLQAASAASSRNSSRLSSQLATLQGSIETRLEALSAAFDAYVELGDVREQLTAFAENADIRRDVLDVVERLATGRDVAVVDDRDSAYWLPYAANAVVALAAGRTDGAVEDRARGLSPDTGLFVVAVLSATGRGSAVADRVPDLLTTDGQLRAPQIALWEAAAAGLYGPEVRAEIGRRWASILTAEPTSGWRGWIETRTGSGAGPAERVAWVGRLARRELTLPLVAPAPGPPLEPSAAAVEQLRAVVAAMVGEGAPNEADLLRRARELRARIEDPGSRLGRGGARETVTTSTERTQSVPDVVRRMISTTSDPALQQELLRWVAGGLSATVRDLAAGYRPPVAQIEVRTPSGAGLVGPDGLEPGRLAALETSISEAYPDHGRALRIWAAVGGLVVVLTVVTGLAGNVGLATLLGIAAAAAIVMALKQLADQRHSRHGRAEETEALTAKVRQASEQAAALDASGREETAQIGREVRQTCAALDELAGASS